MLTLTTDATKIYNVLVANHHTRDRHVGFLFTCKGIGKINKMLHNFLFSS